MATDLDTFREETRAWLDENCPAGVRGPGTVPNGSTKIELDTDTRLWLERMVEKGWTVPTWPKEYGGAELSREEYKVLVEELQRVGARPPLTGRGVNYIGPTLLEFGTDQQKAKWLPGMAAGKGCWAMGYSEPGAGSDLASLKTRAVRDGDQWVINGSKIWTSGATYSDYIFVLCRTSPDKPKHDGISLILVDMSQPGVQARPIRLISGSAEFCETHFDNAVADIDDLIGGIDRGWTVGKRLLQFERSTHAGINVSGSEGGRESKNSVREKVLGSQARDNGRLADETIRDRLAAHDMTYAAKELTRLRAVAETKALAPTFASSAVKLSSALNAQEGDELILAARGSDIFEFDFDQPGDNEELKKWLGGKSGTIAGGTKEIQLNIIAKRVLGLPD